MEMSVDSYYKYYSDDQEQVLNERKQMLIEWLNAYKKGPKFLYEYIKKNRPDYKTMNLLTFLNSLMLIENKLNEIQ